VVGENHTKTAARVNSDGATGGLFQERSRMISHALCQTQFLSAKCTKRTGKGENECVVRMQIRHELESASFRFVAWKLRRTQHVLSWQYVRPSLLSKAVSCRLKAVRCRRCQPLDSGRPVSKMEGNPQSVADAWTFKRHGL